MAGVVQKTGMAVLGAAVLFTGGLAAYADTTVIDGPGFTYEKKRGWFGREEKVYKDALGNRYVEKKGLFGRKKTESSLFGSTVSKQGDNMTVTGPDGQPMVTTKKSWLRGKQTRVDGNSIWQNIKNAF